MEQWRWEMRVWGRGGASANIRSTRRRECRRVKPSDIGRGAQEVCVTRGRRDAACAKVGYTALRLADERQRETLRRAVGGRNAAPATALQLAPCCVPRVERGAEGRARSVQHHQTRGIPMRSEVSSHGSLRVPEKPTARSFDSACPPSCTLRTREKLRSVSYTHLTLPTICSV